MMLGIRDAVRARWIVTIVLRFTFGVVIVAGVIALAVMILVSLSAGPEALFWPLMPPLLQIGVGVLGFWLAELAAIALVPLHYRCPKCARPLSLSRTHPFCPGCDLSLDGPPSS